MKKIIQCERLSHCTLLFSWHEKFCIFPFEEYYSVWKFFMKCGVIFQCRICMLSMENGNNSFVIEVIVGCNNISKVAMILHVFVGKILFSVKNVHGAQHQFEDPWLNFSHFRQRWFVMWSDTEMLWAVINYSVWNYFTRHALSQLMTFVVKKAQQTINKKCVRRDNEKWVTRKRRCNWKNV